MKIALKNVEGWCRLCSPALFIRTDELLNVATLSSGKSAGCFRVRAIAFPERRINFFTPAESLLFVAIVVLVFLRVSLAGAAIPLSRTGMLPGAGINHAMEGDFRITSMRGLSGLGFADVSPILITGKSVLAPCRRGARQANPASWGLAAPFNRPASGFCGLPGAGCCPDVDQMSFNRAEASFNLSEFQSIPRGARLSGFGPSLDRPVPAFSTPRLS